MGIAEVKLRQRDLGILSLGTMEEREWKLQSSPEVEDDYLYPLSKSSRCSLTHPEVSALVGLESPGRVTRSRSLWLEGTESPDSRSFRAKVPG
jgi:hypothetical protein